MSNQDIQGKAPADEAPGAPAGTPEYLEQQLAKEREARALMRDRLRHTEALAAESHALRARMAQELERVTADRDRLRTAAASATPAGGATAEPPPVATPPQPTPRFEDLPLRPPMPPKRGAPWGALGMLGALALAVGAFAWYSGSVRGVGRPFSNSGGTVATTHDAPGGATATPHSTPRLPPPTAASVLAADTPATSAPATPGNGPVPLPPLTAEAQLAAAPTAAGPARLPSTPAPTSIVPSPSRPAAPPAMVTRLRQALDGEGIASPVDVDAASGHVTVADPQADAALRSRTDMLIRAVYAGASLPEPQIEHRWISPMRGSRPLATSEAPAAAASPSPAAAYAARHPLRDQPDPAGSRQHHGAGTPTVADVEALRPVLPEGRVTASCRESLAGRTVHRADMTACMKRSCCSTAANHNAEDCRAYEKAYPFTCGG